MAKDREQAQPEPVEKRVVREVRLLFDASFPLVDAKKLNRSEEARLAVICFALGAIHSYVKPEKLSPPQVHAITIRLIDESFGWPLEETVGVVGMAIDAVGNPHVRDVMKVGTETMGEWNAGQREEASRRLAELIEIVTDSDDD